MSALPVDADQISTFARALFRHASDGQRIAIRSYYEESEKTHKTESVVVNGAGLDPVIRVAVSVAQAAANASEKVVFCPPIAGFSPEEPEDYWRAREIDLKEGYALSVECDEKAKQARNRLEAVLGAPTVVVESGGQWENQNTGEMEPKLHLHWRLVTPATNEALATLKEARRLATAYVGGDATNINVVHPIRWPGSYHRKAEPKLARIVSLEDDREIDLAEAVTKLRVVAPQAQGLKQEKRRHEKCSKNPFGFSTSNYEADILDVTAALAVIPNNDLTHWDDWNRIGMATWLASAERAFASFDAWSQKSAKYDPETTKARWEHYDTSPPDKIGAGTLFHLAREAMPGWRKPSEFAQSASAGAEPPSSPVVRTAYDLGGMTFPDIKFVVERYILEGATILAGNPKIGKSWFVLQIGLAVAEGGECLGEMCEQGDVLYLALEDNERRLQRRIRKLRPVPSFDGWPQTFHYATEWPRADEGGIEHIRTWAKSVERPRLVIIDVLAMFRPGRGERDSLYESDYKAIKSLQALASELGLAIIIVHHTRKGREESDPFEKVSGTLGLSGGADTTLILSRNSNGTTLYGRGRDIEEVETAVEFDRETCLWRALGEASEVRQTDERSTILKALKDAGEAMTPADLSVATGMTSNNIRQLLFKMVKAGEVRKVGRGKYAHPSVVVAPDADDYRRARDGDDNDPPF